jgi:transcriptional regulator with XRE-family HTH domain
VRKYIQEKELRRKNAIGTKLKKMIKASGMTKEEIAGRMGIQAKTLDTSYLAPGAKIPKRGLSRLLLILQGESKE